MCFFYFFCFSFFQRVIGKLVPQDGSRLQHGILTFVVDKKYGFFKIIIIINILTKERGEHWVEPFLCFGQMKVHILNVLRMYSEQNGQLYCIFYYFYQLVFVAFHYFISLSSKGITQIQVTDAFILSDWIQPLFQV